MILKNFIIVCFISCSFSINAQTILTDRPDQTEGSSTIPKGSFQIETGVLISYTEDGTNKERQILSPSTLFRISILEGFELRLVNQLESLKYNNANSVTGISDLEIGAKLQLLHKENVNTEIAILSHVILPTGSKELSGNAFGTVNKLSVSHSINEIFGLGYNLGYNYFGEDNGDFTYSCALGVAMTDKIGLYIEPYGEWVNFEEYQSNVDAGFTYLLKENLQFDVSFGTGINHTMNYIAAGCSINFSK